MVIVRKLQILKELKFQKSYGFIVLQKFHLYDLLIWYVSYLLCVGSRRF